MKKRVLLLLGIVSFSRLIFADEVDQFAFGLEKISNEPPKAPLIKGFLKLQNKPNVINKPTENVDFQEEKKKEFERRNEWQKKSFEFKESIKNIQKNKVNLEEGLKKHEEELKTQQNSLDQIQKIINNLNDQLNKIDNDITSINNLKPELKKFRFKSDKEKDQLLYRLNTYFGIDKKDVGEAIDELNERLKKLEKQKKEQENNIITNRQKKELKKKEEEKKLLLESIDKQKKELKTINNNVDEENNKFQKIKDEKINLLLKNALFSQEIASKYKEGKDFSFDSVIYWFKQRNADLANLFEEYKKIFQNNLRDASWVNYLMNNTEVFTKEVIKRIIHDIKNNKGNETLKVFPLSKEGYMKLGEALKHNKFPFVEEEDVE